MSTTIVIKKSNVAGREPSTLQPAELAVNLKDQKLFTADADGNVFELGGSGSGVVPGPLPPDDKEPGDLWYDSSNNTLHYWNGSQWVELEASTGASVDSVNGKSGVVILKTSDIENDSGYITISDVPDAPVTSVNGETGIVDLTAADVGALASGDDVSDLNNDAGYLTSADLPDDTLWLQGTGAIYPKELTDNVQVGGTAADPNISLNADGSASFKGDVQVKNAGHFRIRRTGDDTSNSAYIYPDGTAAFSNGNITFDTDGSASFDGPVDVKRPDNSNSEAFAVYDGTTKSVRIKGFGDVQLGGANVGTAPNIGLYGSDGSATFAGDVSIGDSTTFRGNAEIITALSEDIRKTFESALKKWEKATPYDPEDPSTLPADETLKEAIIRVTTAGKINLNSDGSANFKNNVGIGTDSPVTKLQIKGTSNYDPVANPGNDFDFRVTSGTASLSIGQANGVPVLQSQGSGTSYAICMNPYIGNVGIGTDSPAEKLHVDGKIRANDYDLEALPPLSTAP